MNLIIFEVSVEKKRGVPPQKNAALAKWPLVERLATQ
jgi:hypothetical protein